jgi:hypothetical protein
MSDAADDGEELLALREAVLDMCALLDVAGEKSQPGPDGYPSGYFHTVSMNIGMARVAIEQHIGTAYYEARYEHYKRATAPREPQER